MGRDPRYIPRNSLQHVTDVTFQNRRFLQPSREVNRLFLGILGRAQKKHDMEICAVVVMSTHVHYLLRPRDAAHLAAFMSFVKTNISKEIGSRLRNWKGRFFDGRYHSTTVSDEEAAQVAVLRYILAHGPKELLVDTVSEWPGVHSAVPTLEGRDMVGDWVDRTSASKAGRAGESEVFVSEERVEISPIPCLRHLSRSEWRRVVAEIIAGIDEEASLARKSLRKRSLGKRKIVSGDPSRRPKSTEKSPKPRFHASSREARWMMTEAWREIIQCYREASNLLRSGARNVIFPEGTFPPSLPFVPFGLGAHLATSRGRP